MLVFFFFLRGLRGVRMKCKKSEKRNARNVTRQATRRVEAVANHAFAASARNRILIAEREKGAISGAGSPSKRRGWAVVRLPAFSTRDKQIDEGYTDMCAPRRKTQKRELYNRGTHFPGQPCKTQKTRKVPRKQSVQKEKHHHHRRGKQRSERNGHTRFRRGTLRRTTPFGTPPKSSIGSHVVRIFVQGSTGSVNKQARKVGLCSRRYLNLRRPHYRGGRVETPG